MEERVHGAVRVDRGADRRSVLTGGDSLFDAYRREGRRGLRRVERLIECRCVSRRAEVVVTDVKTILALVGAIRHRDGPHVRLIDALAGSIDQHLHRCSALEVNGPQDVEARPIPWKRQSDDSRVQPIACGRECDRDVGRHRAMGGAAWDNCIEAPRHAPVAGHVDRRNVAARRVGRERRSCNLKRIGGVHRNRRLAVLVRFTAQRSRNHVDDDDLRLCFLCFCFLCFRALRRYFRRLYLSRLCFPRGCRNARPAHGFPLGARHGHRSLPRVVGMVSICARMRSGSV